MAGKIKAWVWVIVAIVAIGILGVVAMAGVGLYFFSQHVQTRSVSVGSAARDFDQVRRRFEGQKPLIELDQHGTIPALERGPQAAGESENAGVDQRDGIRSRMERRWSGSAFRSGSSG